jgi:cellulose synthase/poly-beta-1,6-N-acetylglucosamine synthase-like glycosyltransferase
MLQLIFWCGAVFILYTYAGYPLLLWAWSRRSRPQPPRSEEATPFVSIIVTVRNEEANIGRKVAELLRIDYAADRFEILVASDASSDGTHEIVEAFTDPRVQLVSHRQRIGKVEAINRTVPLARGEILVFMDARQQVPRGTVRALLRRFGDPEVGMVGGELALLDEEGQPSAEGAGLYWRYEAWLRGLEADLRLLAGVSGCCFAMRRELFCPAPAGTILDDVVYPLQVLLQGKRIWWEKEARVYDRVMASGVELGRKVRSLTGNYQLLLRFWPLFCPWRGRVAFALISHKLCRLLVPLALIAMAASSIELLRSPLYTAALVGQTALYLLGTTGILSRWARRQSRLINACGTFCLLNLAALMALLNFILRGARVAWR